jgi:Recombination endonuclease VII
VVTVVTPASGADGRKTHMIYGSVCSGIEAVTVAWESLGFPPAWFAEIDPFCSALMAHRYPNMENLGDFRSAGPLTPEPVEKVCSRCHATKLLSEFHRQKSARFGRHSWCKECANRAHLARRRKPNPTARRRHNLRAKYGLSAEDVEQMLMRQGGVCAICRKPPARPCIDHDHRTGIVRGVLCHRCNIFMAAIDDPGFRTRAGHYLKRARKETDDAVSQPLLWD